jgi:hypothetical protein
MKEDYLEIIKALDTSIKKNIELWHEKRIEQIRLETANKRHLEDYKFEKIKQMKKMEKPW